MHRSCQRAASKCNGEGRTVIRSTYAQDSVQEPPVTVRPNVEQQFCTEETGGMVCEVCRWVK